MGKGKRMKLINLEEFGDFEGGKTIEELSVSLTDVPSSPGVYVVLRNGIEKSFLERSTGGIFKNKKPSVLIDTLEKKWVDEVELIYIGETGSLRKRLTDLISFGSGIDEIAHYGGRYIWQLKNSNRLRIYWQVTEPNEHIDKKFDMINKFKAIYDKYPFAVLKNSKRKYK